MQIRLVPNINQAEVISSAASLRHQLSATVAAVLGLFSCALGIPEIFRVLGYPQSVQTTLPDAPLWLLIAFIVFLGPYLEELVFRQWLINGLEKLQLPYVAATLISTVLWIASHLPPTIQAGLVFAGTGLILCALRRYTNRLWPCVVAHIIYNAPAALILLKG